MQEGDWLHGIFSFVNSIRPGWWGIMTITQIECFVEAAKMKSLSKAAENMFISRPTISRQIKALESDLGFELFERKNVGVRLTQTGEILYEEC